MNDDQTTKHSMLVGIWKQVISFIVGVVVAAFVVGSARQKVQDLVRWKEETAPRIERMDRQGTVSFEHFHETYNKEQANQYARLKHLEDEINHLDKLDLRVERLEKKVGEDP